MPLDPELLARFHRALVDEIRRSRPEYLDHSFTVAEIYQDLIPYRTHRNVIGVAMNGDYEDALTRLLAGEGDYLVLDSEPARRELRKELESSNPDTSLYREFATVDVRLNPAVREWVAPDLGGEPTEGSDDQRPGQAHGETGSAEPGEEGAPAGAAPAAHAAGNGHAASDDGAPAPGAGPDTPDAESPDAAVADTGVRLWAIDAADAEDPSGHAAEVGVEGEEGGVPREPCSWCGELLPDRPEMSYCPHCGGDIRLVPCPACGEALERSWRFCVVCGTEVAAS